MQEGNELNLKSHEQAQLKIEYIRKAKDPAGNSSNLELQISSSCYTYIKSHAFQ